MKSVKRQTAGAIAALAVASVALAGCGNATKGSSAAAATGGAGTSASAAASGDTSSYGTNAITLNVYGGVITMSGVDAAKHDAILPSSWVVKEGQTFTLTVINYDDGQHSITAPDLGLNFIVAPGKKDDATKKVTPTTSTTTFVATKTGAFHWYCAFPCDGPSHLGMTTTGNNGRGYDMIMAGEIVVKA